MWHPPIIIKVWVGGTFVLWFFYPFFNLYAFSVRQEITASISVTYSYPILLHTLHILTDEVYVRKIVSNIIHRPAIAIT